MKTVIIALKYEEKEWENTWESISRCRVPIIIAERGGVGNMAKAYNDAFFGNLESVKRFEYVWFVSNITFDRATIESLEEGMEVSGFAGIHPSFKSDHQHIRPTKENKIKEAPFFEFTAPIIKTDVFEKYPLDERMPYIGHDLDWGYRVREGGHSIGIYHGVEIDHTYIRFNKRPEKVTEIRKRLRALWDRPTELVLEKKYGKEWKTILQYK